MKKSFKKIIAIFISVLMIMTSLPFTAMTAFAETAVSNSSNLTLRWFVDDLTSDESGHNRTNDANSGVSWGTVGDYTAATFKNGRAKYQTSSNLLNDGIASAIESSGSAGTTIAFMAKANTISAAPYFCIYNSAYSSDGSKKTLFSLAPNGATVYTNNEGTAHNKSNSDTNAAISAGDWHTFVIKFWSNSSEQKVMVIFVDGVRVYKESSAFYDNHTFDIPNTVKVGANRETDTYFDGSIRDFRIYNKDLDAPSVHQNLLDIAAESTVQEATKTGTLTKDAFGLIRGGDTTRINGEVFNIVNDQEPNNTSAGIIRYDISKLKGYTVTDAKLNAKVDSYNTESLATSFFYSTSAICALYTTGGSTKVNVTSGSGTTGRDSYLSTLGSSSSKKIGTIAAGNTSVNQFSLTNAINEALSNGSKYIYIIIVKDTAGGSGSSGGWSDTNVTASSQTISYSASLTNYTRDDVANIKKDITDVKVNKAPYSANVTSAVDNSYNTSNLATTDKLSSVLYTYGCGGSSGYSSMSNDHYCNAGIQFGNVTFLYDGVNDMAFPISFFTNRTSNVFGTNWNQKPHSLYCSTSNVLEHRTIWHGCTTSNDGMYVSTTASGINIVNDHVMSNPKSKDLSSSGTDRYSNTLYVKPSGLTFNNNLATIDSVSWTYYYADDNKSETNGYSGTITVNNDQQRIRVINYKNIHDAIVTAKTIYAKISADESSYCPNDIYKFYFAFNKLISLNPNDYFSSSTNNYQECANAITAASVYISDATTEPSKSNREYTHSYTDGEAKGTQQHTLHCNDCGEDITEACTWDEGEVTTPATCTADGVKTFTCTKCNGTATAVETAIGAHDWALKSSTAANCGVASTENYECNVCHTTMTEHATAASGTHTMAYTSNGNGTHNGLCSVCHEVSTQVTNEACTPAEAVEDDGYMVTNCELCGAELSRIEIIDYTAYNNIITQVTALVEADYTAESWAELETAKNADISVCTTQAQVDAIVSAIQTAKNNLVKAEVKYTVTVYKQVDSESPELVGEPTEVVAGTPYTATVDTDLSVVKWTVDANDKISKIGTVENSVTAIINGNTEFIVYLTSDEVVSNVSNVKVTYLGYSNNVTAVKYYPSVNDIVKTGEYAQSVPFYVFKAWNIKKIAENEYVYTATYEPANGEISANVISLDSSEVLVNEAPSTNAYYDSVVFIKGDRDKVVKMITSDGTVSYFKNVGYMHVPHSTTVKIDLVDASEVGPQTAITGKYTEKDATGATVAAFNANYYLPEGAEFVECGTVMTVRETIKNDLSRFVINGDTKVKATKSQSQSDVNEYTIAYHANFGEFTKAYGRSYLTYTMNGTETTIYSEVVELEL